jgi:hypothetical protein
MICDSDIKSNDHAFAYACGHYVPQGPRSQWTKAQYVVYKEEQTSWRQSRDKTRSEGLKLLADQLRIETRARELLLVRPDKEPLLYIFNSLKCPSWPNSSDLGHGNAGEGKAGAVSPGSLQEVGQEDMVVDRESESSISES